MKNKPTSEQLVDMLEDNLDITICADVVHGLDLEYKALQERIDKAIEFMNKWGIQPDYDMSVEMREYEEFQKLLEILKGDD